MKSACMLVATLVALVALGSEGLAQQHQWFQEPGSGHWYALTLTATDWHSAEAEAVSLGGHLVTIESAAENDWLFSTFCPDPMDECWIGYSDEAVEGTWVWVSGSTSTWTNWETGEPNNQGNEDFAHLWQGHAGKWNDVQASRNQPGIIEIEVPPALLFSVDNLVAGQVATLSVSNGYPGAEIYFAYSTKGSGPTTTIYGFDVDLSQPISVHGPSTTSASGFAFLTVGVPTSAPVGASVWLQAVENDGGIFRVSNLVAETIG